MKTNKILLFITCVALTGIMSAQIKVTTSGKTTIGYVGTPPSKAQTHLVKNTLFSASSSGTGAMIKGVDGVSATNKPDYTWYTDTTTGIFHPANNVIGFTIGSSEKFRINSNGKLLAYSSADVSKPEFSWKGDSLTGIYHPAASTIGFSINGNGKIRLDANGNTTFSSNYSSLTGGSSAALIRGRNTYSDTLTPDYTWWGNDKTGFFHPAANVIGFSLDGVEKMRLHSNGFVGISKKSPAYMLDLGSGDINIGSINNGYRINTELVLTQRNIASSLFVGKRAGYSTTGAQNIAIGAFALYSNTSATFNLAIGDSALYSNTTSSNSAAGTGSMRYTSTGSNNSAFGGKTLYKNTTGAANVAFGSETMYTNTTGGYNAGYGYQALYKATSSANTAIGAKALYENTTGTHNTALGYQAGIICSTGSYNTLIGSGADVSVSTYSNTVVVGYNSTSTASNKAVIGNSTTSVIGGFAVWSNFSDGRFKTEVTENVKGLDFIKKLRPVTYKVNTSGVDDYLIQNMPDSLKQSHKAGMNFTESSAVIHSGFIAQEVEQAALQVGFSNTIVSKPSNERDLYGIAYGELVVPLVKAMQEQNAQVDSLIETTHKLDSVNRVLQQQLTDIVNNCCQRSPSSTNRGVNQSTPELHQQETNNWLAQNKPNPFNKETVIEYSVVQEGKGSIMIFDMNGKLLKTIPVKIPGKGSITINANDFIAGMYYYSLVVNDVEVDTKKMILTEQ